MLKITDAEHQKLVSLANDEVAIEALKKFFLEVFLNDENTDHKADILVGSRLAITFLKEGFTTLLRLKEETPENTVRKNIV